LCCLTANEPQQSSQLCYISCERTSFIIMRLVQLAKGGDA